ncbi:MAG: D-tyrosyl-tRNA(Tyr) deacylase [Magnetococcales bacterium]|nr:D-tyrosyl-tRNA(Tyr) deacylase [Magnetococcales bacterium]HIJ83210.1 D-tyrosyl-tRNA(Tyr) deacylase [Magnetococcales bacterium]
MRALVQKVLQASVYINGEETGRIDHGLLVYLAIMRGDSSEQLEKMIGKVGALRIFPDREGKMNLSVKDVGGGVLVVSQFTLAADMRKGTRPSFSQAADPATASDFIDAFCKGLRQQQLPVATGRFAADMKVHSINDGPVTLWLDFPNTKERPESLAICGDAPP